MKKPKELKKNTDKHFIHNKIKVVVYFKTHNLKTIYNKKINNKWIFNNNNKLKISNQKITNKSMNKFNLIKLIIVVIKHHKRNWKIQGSNRMIKIKI